MRWFVCLVATALMPCVADDLSGPNHTTLRRAWWGSLFYDPAAMGPHQMESTLDDVRLRSRRGEVRISGSEVSGYTLSAGPDTLSIRTTNGDLEIRWKDRLWTWRTQNGSAVLAQSQPRESVAFERSANEIRIKGAQGVVTLLATPELLTLKAPGGTALVRTYLGDRSFSGLAVDQIPYLGRGVYISFHGVGILIDVARLFPMPEVAEWNEWKPVLGLPFDPNAN